MIAIVFTGPLSYYVKLASECYMLALQYNYKNEANNPISCMKFKNQRDCCKLLEEYLRLRLKMDEFTKSLLAPHLYIWKYGARHAQVCGSSSKKSVTKYAVERVQLSLAIEICKINQLIFFSF